MQHLVNISPLAPAPEHSPQVRFHHWNGWNIRHGSAAGLWHPDLAVAVRDYNAHVERQLARLRVHHAHELKPVQIPLIECDGYKDAKDAAEKALAATLAGSPAALHTDSDKLAAGAFAGINLHPGGGGTLDASYYPGSSEVPAGSYVYGHLSGTVFKILQGEFAGRVVDLKRPPLPSEVVPTVAPAPPVVGTPPPANFVPAPQQPAAKASKLAPRGPLHVVIVGKTGSGKTLLRYALEELFPNSDLRFSEVTGHPDNLTVSEPPPLAEPPPSPELVDAFRQAETLRLEALEASPAVHIHVAGSAIFHL